MTLEQWNRIRHFRHTENWGDPLAMDFAFVSLVDAFRAFIGLEMIVTHGTQGKHAERSLHYSGKAGDFVFAKARPQDLLNAFIQATRFPFSGVGLYPHWKANGKTVGGLHLEFAGPETRGNTFERSKYWLGVPNPEADPENPKYYPAAPKQKYLAVTAEALFQWGFFREFMGGNQ